jgi:hypothetical protein
MAASTGLILTAGALSELDLALTGWQPTQGVRIAAATVLAVFVSAGLDKVIPGLGTGAAVVLVAAAVMRSGPPIARALHLQPEG